MAHVDFPLLAPDALLRRQEHVTALRKIVADGVLDSEESLRVYETDALTAYRQRPLCVVLPRHVDEVKAIMAYAHHHGLPVVARGAGTSLSGGSLPSADSLLIALTRMNKIVSLNPSARTAVVQAGATNLSISHAARSHGLVYAPDPSSQVACTLGGNIAMNAGGAHCFKYGVTSNHILGLTVVLADGTEQTFGGETWAQEGYDWLGLLVGSEGQLGLVVEATVRLVPQAEGARPMLLGFPSAATAGACVSAIVAEGIVPVAIEYMDKPCIHACEAFAKAGYPLDVEALLLVEVEGSEAEINERLAHIARVGHAMGATSVRISQSEAETTAIWKGRKSAYSAMSALGDYICMDGVIPTPKLPEALEGVSGICSEYGLKVANVFHAGDGNLHPLILYDASREGELEKAEAAGAAILRLCVELGGCLSGEHGIGLEKRDLMPCQFLPHELDLQRAIKRCFDPAWRLNPHKVFPLEAAE